MLWLVVLTIVCEFVNYFPCAAYSRFNSVVLHDAVGSALYFSEIIQIPENNYRTDFKRWSNDRRRKACLDAFVDSASFLVVEKIDVDRVAELGLHKFDKFVLSVKIDEAFQFADHEKVTYKLALVEIEAEKTIVLEVPAHFCPSIREDAEDEDTEIQFAVTSGFHQNELFLLSKRSNYPKFKPIAIVEPILSLEGLSLKSEDLDNEYLTANVNSHVTKEEDKQQGEEKLSKNDVSASSAPLKSLVKKQHRVCDVDEFRRYRLCATAYTAWMQFKKELYTEIDYIVRPGLSCLRNVKILLSRNTHDEDLLPCLIRGNPRPQIFIASDGLKKDSIFLLEEVRSDDSNRMSEHPLDSEVVGYRLVLHLHNVLPLKTFDDAI